jgi:nucleoid-associated protein YgaU
VTNRVKILAILGIAVMVAGLVTVGVRSGSSTSSATPRPALTVPATHPTTQTPPSSRPPSTVASPPASASPHPKPRTEPRRATREADKGPITYTVKSGDNLWSIARWFHLHGYGALYRWNRTVIGANPALIFPAQKITVSAAGNTSSK